MKRSISRLLVVLSLSSWKDGSPAFFDSSSAESSVNSRNESQASRFEEEREMERRRKRQYVEAAGDWERRSWPDSPRASYCRHSPALPLGPLMLCAAHARTPVKRRPTGNRTEMRMTSHLGDLREEGNEVLEGDVVGGRHHPQHGTHSALTRVRIRQRCRYKLWISTGKAHARWTYLPQPRSSHRAQRSAAAT